MSSPNPKFVCNCQGGRTVVLSETSVQHACGFRASLNTGEAQGAGCFYDRVTVNPALTGGEVRFNWFRRFISRPISR